MMDPLCAALCACLQIVFAYLFFSTFLERKTGRDQALFFLLVACIAGAVYSCFAGPGVYGYFAQLLAAVLMLLCLFAEEGWKGLGLLALSFLIGISVDMALGFHPLARTAGKLLALGIPFLIRRSRSSLRRQEGENDMLLLRQHMQMQADSIAALEQSYRAQRKSTHEFEHHMQVLGDLLDQNATDTAREYLHRLRKDRSIQSMSVSSHHPVIDVILNQKYQTARENGIQIQLRVNDLSPLTIPINDLAVILTNLLDNAIEACRGLDGYREIFCSILLEEGLYICVRNTSEPVSIVDGRIPTSKADSLSHGFGLRSVSYLLDKMDAEYTFRYEEGFFHFAAEIDTP